MATWKSLHAVLLALLGLAVPAIAQGAGLLPSDATQDKAEWAQANQELGLELQHRNTFERERLAAHIAEAEARLARLDGEFQRLLSRHAQSGMGAATGALINSLLRTLPTPAQLRIERRDRQEQIAKEELLRSQHLEAYDLLGKRIASVEDRSLPPEVVDLMDAHRELLAQSLAISEEHLAGFDHLNEVGRKYAALVREVNLYADKHLIWVRSRADSRLPSLSGAGRSLIWLFEPSEWSIALRATGRELTRLSFPVVAWTLVGILLLILRRKILRFVLSSGEAVRSSKTDRVRLTLMVICADFLRCACLPAWMMAVSGALTTPASQPEPVVALAGGLAETAPYLWALLFLGACCKVGGLGDQHLRWDKAGMRGLRRVVGWFAPFSALLLVVVEASRMYSSSGDNQSLGDLAFGTLMVGAAIAMIQGLILPGSIGKAITQKSPGGWLARTRNQWAALVVALPIACMILRILGWEYTAQVLFGGLIGTLCLAFGVGLGVSLLHRWRRVARRRLTMAEALHRHEANQAEEVQPESSAASQQTPVVDGVDVSAVDLQTTKLIHSLSVLAAFLGLYLVWNSIFPIFEVLDRVQLWPTPRLVEIQLDDFPTAAEGSAQSPNATPNAGNPPLTGKQFLPESVADQGSSSSTVTLRDVTFSIFILMSTWILVRNATGVVDFVLLNRRRLSAASRFVASTVVRYLLTLVGLGYGFVAIGVEWSEVQWLVAALTFGLAFGLQEVFANFVSGLIILIERPVRIGDTVTVGGVTGEITRIRIRATEIRDWDRKELIVPNKSFITDQVVNWSLSDPILRVKVPVGVSYEADAKQVIKILLQVAAEAPEILRDPNPQALFLGFGESSLDFELRCFIPSLADWMPVRSRLHARILEVLREAGIEIAYPQRDLHLRSADTKVEVVSRTLANGDGAASSPED